MRLTFSLTRRASLSWVAVWIGLALLAEWARMMRIYAARQDKVLDEAALSVACGGAQLGEMAAAQDEAGRAGFKGGIAGAGLYHRYNAVVKRMTGNKNRAQMTLAELEAAIGWRERLCCTDLPEGRGRPNSPFDLRLREADVLRPSEFKHPVHCIDGNGDLGRSAPIGVRS